MARRGLGRAAALALAPLALFGAGCAKQIAEANLPAVPIPPEPPPAVAAPPPPPAPAPAASAPTPVPTPAPSRPAPSRPAPLVTTPAPSPAPAPIPAPVVPPPVPPPVLSAHVGGEEERRLTQAAQTRIDDAEKIVGRLDQRRLGRAPHQETYSTIQSFLVKAKEAMSAKDYQRAYTLADKAQILAEELAQAIR